MSDNRLCDRQVLD